MHNVAKVEVRIKEFGKHPWDACCWGGLRSIVYCVVIIERYRSETVLTVPLGMPLP